MKTNFERLVLDEALDAVTAVNVDGRLVHWSKGAETMFGYTSAEALGRQLRELIVPTDRHEEEQRMRQEIMERGSATFESIRRRKDGALVYVDISSKVIRDSQGRIECILSSKKDVTQLKVLRDAKLFGYARGELHGVVAVTAYPEKFSKSEALASARDTYYLKPINTRTLAHDFAELV